MREEDAHETPPYMLPKNEDSRKFRDHRLNFLILLNKLIHQGTSRLRTDPCIQLSNRHRQQKDKMAMPD